ncbi:MAG: PAS domain S-box protein [Deltaproteobacteria bacterium]|nr:PAS domain S-box protein [Deltaproteobacteria bacterium]
MKPTLFRFEPEINKESIQIVRGRQSKVIFNAGVIGGGNACLNLLKLLDEDRSSRLKMRIIGVSDINPDSPGYVCAKKLNLFTTTNFKELFSLKGLNLIIELTGSYEVLDQIIQSKPSNLSVIDHVGARFLWDLIQLEVEKVELEKEWHRYLEALRKQTKVIPDSLPYRIMVINMDKTVETVNQTFLNAFNLTESMVLGKHCYELKYGIDRPCMRSENNRCYIDDNLAEIKEKGIFSTYEEYPSKSGKSRCEVITMAPIFDDDGEIVQILEASRDVTDRIELEREAEKSNTFLQNVIQSTVDGIVVVDTKGNVLIYNKGMERLTGFPANEIINKRHLSTFYDIETARANMEKMRSDKYGPPGKLNPTSMTIKTRYGEEIPVTLSASIITIEGKEIGSVGVFTDMREILEMRRNLEEAHLQLVQSEKIASVGRMAAGVAHEINNPLSGIMIYAELLKENLKDNLQHLKDVQEIITQTLRCKKIVSDLLEFSRQSVGKVSSFSVEELINKSLNLFVNQALFQDIQVQQLIEEGMPHMVGDPGQLQQVLTNLLLNAADAMHGKGRLNIDATFDHAREYFIIKVSDTGPGIPKDLHDKIFDIFFTTKPVGKGTGLGLSITKNIIQLHGGNIMVDSAPGKGTSFIIELPLGFVDQPQDEPVFIGLDE